MHMLNPHCGVDRDPRGVVRLTICNAGSLNILGSAVIKAVREGLEALATERHIRVLVLAGQSEKSMIGGADIKEMAGSIRPRPRNSSPACAISAKRCARFRGR
jgi:enoyl-CoA hydratase